MGEFGHWRVLTLASSNAGEFERGRILTSANWDVGEFVLGKIGFWGIRT